MANQADATASFAIDLESGAVSNAAESAATALEGLRGRIEAGNKELAAMQRAMRNLKGAAQPPTQQLEALQKAIAEKKNAVAGAQASFLSLGGTFTKTRTSSTGLKAQLEAMIKQAQTAPGPLGVMVGRFEALKTAVGGGAIAVGIVGIVAGLGLLVAATVKAISTLYEYGLAQADARRSELLRLEGLTKMRNWWGIAAGNAGELQAAIDQVSASTALGREKVAQYAEQLYRMNLRGTNLQAALEGVAIKATTQGDAAAGAFGQWAAGANLAGRSVRALADDVKARLGGVAQAQMLSLGVQTAKLHESFDALFNGLKIEGFLKAKSEVFALFSQATNSGKALKALLTALLQPLVGTAESGAPVIKRFFQGMIISALKVGILLQQVRLWFKRTFGASDILKGFDAQRAALSAGKVALGLFAGGLALATTLAAGLALKIATFLVPALWSMVSGAAALAVEGLVIAAPFLLAAAAIFSVINTARLLVKLWKEIDFKLLGQYMWQGIVDGIKAGGKAVLDAVESLGSTALKGFKAALGIASPSRMFARLGLAIPAGVGVGVQTGTPAVRRAVGDMVQPQVPVPVPAPIFQVATPGPASFALAAQEPAAVAPRLGPPAAPTGAPGGAVAGRSTQVSVGEIHVHTQAHDARGIVVDLKRELEQVLEGLAIQMGAATS